MHEIYKFVSGPMVCVAFSIFILGSFYRIFSLLSLVRQKESFIFSYMSLKYSLRSILRWSIPFSTTNMRLNPVMTIVTYIFHLCLLITPVFLLAHVLLIEESWGISWWTLPEWLSDLMTLGVIGGCLYFLYRRLFLAQVKFVTTAADFGLLLIVAAPFITGFLAYHQWFAYQTIMILHVVCGEIMLIAIPFTRLSHMLLAPFTRAYLGSEFGGVRQVRDW